MLPTFANQEIGDSLQRVRTTIVPNANGYGSQGTHTQYKREQPKNNDTESSSHERQVVYTRNEGMSDKVSSGLQKYSHLLPESQKYSNNDDSSEFSDEFLHGD